MDSGINSLVAIVAATLAGGALSIAAAALLTFGLLARLVRWLVSLSAGLLLATSTLHLLPEAVDRGGDIHRIGAWLLVGLLAFFALEKLALLRHSHHHEGDGHHHHHGHDREEAGPGGALILIGDSIHNFTDGILIAASFVADPTIGWVTAVAVAAHEIPQEVGDFIVLLNAGYSRARAIAFNLVSSLASVAGGVLGWAFLDSAREALPAVLAFAAAGFLYVALADIVPSLHRHQDEGGDAKGGHGHGHAHGHAHARAHAHGPASGHADPHDHGHGHSHDHGHGHAHDRGQVPGGAHGRGHAHAGADAHRHAAPAGARQDTSALRRAVLQVVLIGVGVAIAAVLTATLHAH